LKKLGKSLILSTSILFGVIATSISPVGLEKAMASSTINMVKTTYQTTANLNLRSGAGTKYKNIITIPKGKTVTATAKNGSWLKLSYTYKLNGKNVTKTGWASSAYLKEYYQYVTTANTYYFTIRTARLYSTPDTKKKAVYTIAGKNGLASKQRIVNSIGQTWYKVSYNGKTLYINNSDVKKNAFTSFTATKYKTQKDTYVHQSYGNAYKKLVKIPKGTIITSSKRIGDWYSVTYNKVSGYFYIGDVAKYTPITYKYTNTSATNYFTVKTANLYSAPDTTKKAVYSVASNNGFASTQKVVNSLGQIFYRVSYNGKTLYINNSDVKKNAFTSFTTTKYKAQKDTYVYQSYGNTYKKLVKIPKGAIITSSKRIGDWYSVTYNKVSGYFYIGDVAKYTPITYKYTNTSATYYFTAKTANLYSTPDITKKAVYSVASNNGFVSTQKVVNSLGQTFYRVNYSGKTLYINNSDVKKNAFTSFTATKYKTQKDTYVYQSYGNAYKKLVKIPKGVIITSSKRIGDWYSVTYNKVSGYFYIGDVAKYIALTYKSTDTKATYYFTKNAAKLYSSADNLNKEKYSVGSNNGFVSTQMITNSLGQTWYRVSYNGTNVYVNKNDVTVKTSATFTKAQFKANVNTYLYQSYGKDYKKLTPIPKNTVISSTSSVGDWYKVTYNGASGYVYSGDVTTYIPETKIADTTYLTTDNLNLRTMADPNSTLLATIPKGTIILATYKVSNGWYKVQYGSKTGYVNGSYIKQVTTGAPLQNRDSYQFIDLRTKSPVTAKQINDYIAKYVNATGKKSVLTGKGQAFIDAGNKYGINALYLAAHAIHESAYGTSMIALAKNNLFGFGSYDDAPFLASYKFASVDLCIDYLAREIKSTYLNPNNWKFNGYDLGFSTKDMNNTRIDANSEGMNFYYASDPNWGKVIAQHMQNILPYDKAYYKNAAVNSTIPARPSSPAGSDLFPNNVRAIANTTLVLDSGKGKNDAVKTLKKGSTFFILEKTNDYWVRVVVDNKTYWTNDIKFDSYKNYLSVTNLGRTTDSVNFRKAPSTSGDKIKVLDPSTYVSIILAKDGSLTMDSTKKWYNVQLADGTKGWVSAAYITLELR